MRPVAALATIVIPLVLGTNAEASVLSFDDIPGSGIINLGPSIPPWFGVYKGFRFGSTSSTNRVDAIQAASFGHSAHSDGWAVLNNVYGAAVVTAADGSEFSFASVWVASWNQFNLGTRSIKGFLGGSEVASVAFDLTQDWQRVVGGFSKIDRLELQLNVGANVGTLGFFLFDDLALNEPVAAVPEPSTLLLLGGGLLALAARRRRTP